MVSLSVEYLDDSSSNHGSKGPFSDYPHNAVGGSGPTEKDACNLLTTTLKVGKLTIKEIESMVSKMTTLYKNISDSGAVLIKSKFWRIGGEKKP